LKDLCEKDFDPAALKQEFVELEGFHPPTVLDITAKDKIDEDSEQQFTDPRFDPETEVYAIREN